MINIARKSGNILRTGLGDHQALEIHQDFTFLSGIRLWPHILHILRLQDVLSMVAGAFREDGIARDAAAKTGSSTNLPPRAFYQEMRILHSQALGQQAFEELMRSMLPRMCPHISRFIRERTSRTTHPWQQYLRHFHTWLWLHGYQSWDNRHVKGLILECKMYISSLRNSIFGINN